MDIQGLGWRTDLALLEISGSVLEDRGDHVVVRTPDNPTFWWGNFLMLAGPPADAADARQWIGGVRGRVPGGRAPDVRHRRHGRVRRRTVRRSPRWGWTTEVSTVMTATSVHAPPRPNGEATYRAAASRTPTGSSRSS